MTVLRQYVQDPSGGPLHLMSTSPIADRTLCGEPVEMATHEFGDETATGQGATCSACREKMNLPRPLLRDAIERATLLEPSDPKDREALGILLVAAGGLCDIYDDHGLYETSADSAADQCASLYELLNRVGLQVA